MSTRDPNLIKHLRRQLGFIDESSRSYDSGKVEEAIRIATHLRVLFHDTGKSVSLLKLMGEIDSLKLISTIGLDLPASKLDQGIRQYAPLVMTFGGPSAMSYGPPLSETSKRSVVPFLDWWNEVVSVQSGTTRDGKEQTLRLSRSDVVRAAANEDGGAHVAGKPKVALRALREGIGSMTSTVDGVTESRELTDNHFPLLRQFAYEVANSPGLTSLLS